MISNPNVEVATGNTGYPGVDIGVSDAVKVLDIDLDMTHGADVPEVSVMCLMDEPEITVAPTPAEPEVCIEISVPEAVIEVEGSTYDPVRYEGSYTVCPSVDAQELPTARRYLDGNLVVDKIPYSEVSNKANGLTATIGC